MSFNFGTKKKEVSRSEEKIQVRTRKAKDEDGYRLYKIWNEIKEEPFILTGSNRKGYIYTSTLPCGIFTIITTVSPYDIASADELLNAVNEIILNIPSSSKFTPTTEIITRESIEKSYALMKNSSN